MAQFFDKVFRSSYSSDLHQHLKGLDIARGESYSGTNIYAWITIWIFMLSLVLMINFYYGLFDRPKFSNFWAWLLNLLASASSIFVMAFLRSTNDLKHANYYKELHFNSADCMLFAFTATSYSVFFCIIFSLLMKWWSLNNKKVPF